MNYVIDGYNLFFCLIGEIHPFHKTRELFIAALNERLQQLNLHATLIFDSNDKNSFIFPSKKRLSGLEMIFSPKGLSADEYILERLTIEKYPQTQMIVTSDRVLGGHAKYLGAKTQTTKSFFKMLNKYQAKKDQIKEEKIEQESSFHFNRLLQEFEKKLNDNPEME